MLSADTELSGEAVMVTQSDTEQSFNQDVIVLDVGGTHLRLGHLRAGIASTRFEVQNSSILRVDNAYDVLLKTIASYAADQQLQVAAVVLGIPGMLNKDKDIISHCNNIPQLEGSGLHAMLTKSMRCRIILEQDIMLQLLGEWRCGAAKASPSVFGVYFGTGIGAAYLVDGNPQLQSAAGLQAGHIPLMAQGKRCVCGNTDCVEAYACGHTLLEMAAAFDCSVEQLFKKDDNKQLKQQLDDFVRYQAYLLATLVTLFVPDMILIGGGIPKMDGYPHDKLIDYVHAHVQKPYPAQSVKFTWASLDKSSTLYGAMALLEAS